MHADADKQGLVQGMITGMRGLCNGLGPAMFGLVFSLFHVDLSEKSAATDTNLNVGPNEEDANNTVMEVPQSFLMVAQIVPGPPFVFGALLVILALMVAAFIPENMGNEGRSSQGSRAFDHHSDHSTGSVSKSSKIFELFRNFRNVLSASKLFHLPFLYVLLPSSVLPTSGN